MTEEITIITWDGVKYQREATIDEIEAAGLAGRLSGSPGNYTIDCR